jgi:hypothetical protein
VRQASHRPFRFVDPEEVTVKGRVGIEIIYGVSLGDEDPNSAETIFPQNGTVDRTSTTRILRT